MQLEQSLYESRPISRNGLRAYQVRDLESLSASALYTGDLPSMMPGNVLGSGGDSYGSNIPDVPMYGSAENPISFPSEIPTVKSLPLYGTTSRLFISGQKSSAPALRFDPADKTHSIGHLHVQEETRLNLSEEDATQTYIEHGADNI